MTLTETEKIEKFDLLETKIGQAVERISELGKRCQALEAEKVALEKNLTQMKKANEELSTEITELKTKRRSDGEKMLEEQKILGRIDRMLEKFGELQI